MSKIPVTTVCADCKTREIGSHRLFCTQCRGKRLDNLLDLLFEAMTTEDLTPADRDTSIRKLKNRLHTVQYNLRIGMPTDSFQSV